VEGAVSRKGSARTTGERNPGDIPAPGTFSDCWPPYDEVLQSVGLGVDSGGEAAVPVAQRPAGLDERSS
jgi:hypothetical protein